MIQFVRIMDDIVVVNIITISAAHKLQHGLSVYLRVYLLCCKLCFQNKFWKALFCWDSSKTNNGLPVLGPLATYTISGNSIYGTQQIYMWSSFYDEINHKLSKLIQDYTAHRCNRWYLKVVVSWSRKVILWKLWKWLNLISDNCSIFSIAPNHCKYKNNTY